MIGALSVGLAAQAGDESVIGLLEAAILGLVEGITEFLPISSTGHLIATSSLLGVPSDAANDAFVVAIQVGAITAILFLYRARLWSALKLLTAGRGTGTGGIGRNLLVLLVLAALPAAAVGIALEDTIDAHLFSNTVVATTMVVGGIALIALELWLRRRDGQRALEIEQMTALHALLIGLCQCLALVPGTSRSGATIAGALLLGFSRTAAAEFSFLVGLPILYGACLLKLVEHGREFLGPMLPALLVATATSFVSAALVVGPFVAFLRRHTFVPFAVYRILAGLLLFGLLAAGTVA